MLNPRQTEEKRRTTVDLRIRPDQAPVTRHDALRGGEAYAHALELVSAVQALKYTEEFFRIAHIEAHAVVAHEDHDLVFRPLPGTDLDRRELARSRVLDRVRQQIDEHL